MNRIALIEDHQRLAELVRRTLAAAGIEADVFHTIQAALAGIRNIDYAAIVADRGLPDGDGLQMIRDLRAEGCATPCLILTAKDALHDRIAGLDGGADDYLTKPFPMEELVARIRALLRRPPIVRDIDPAFCDLVISSARSALVCAGVSVSLPPAELQIMLTLARKGEQTVRRAALENAAWGMSDSVTPNALDVALHRLRKKMATSGSKVRIVNVRGQGYALQGPPLAP
ncbi:response regulator transcription factor [Acidovorax sp. GBBC 3334]|uniref:response regulator transcription factor n=1 Tax=Acidovorax sp. GBBC 3334 TaxID=2940496 RepID=UPI00230224D5|nr:response regulator transcription factor [Acidovorax sp. GBBC 3334]MDA8453662.1 response regulator transcription factor [Acidovorax sp. GBBC 3334]